MSISVKPLVSAAAIALLGILGGLAIGQVTTADSAKQPTASASTTRIQSGMLRELRVQTRYQKQTIAMLQRLDTSVGAVESRIGTSDVRGNVQDQLYSLTGEIDKVADSTYGTCREVGSFYCRR